MSSSTKNYVKKLIICYELMIAIILFEINHASNSVLIGNQQYSINFEKSTTSDYNISDSRRYKRQTINNGKNCEIPFSPRHTNYKILGASETTYGAGDFAPEFSTLDISCNEGYALSPLATKRPLCENGKWSETPQSCLGTCPSLMSTETTTVKCRYNNFPLENCLNPVARTIAVLSCKPLYEEPNIRRNPVRVCRNGRWNPSTSLCYPICGIKHPQGVVNIINGTDVTIGDYPWQIGIYNSTTKKLLCGGSIIEQNIILTAAHCISDYNGNVLPESNYLVAAGKYYRKYDEARDQFAQYSNILTIHVPGRYTGRINNFALDIAVLIISDPFTISEAVQPVCIELSEESQSIFLSPNDDGVVTGWGYTQEGRVLSDVLKELIIPYIPYNQCFNELPDSFRRYFTEDKICGGYKNNATSVCGGDSGGALVFKNIQSDRYYIQGIVSTSPATRELVCDSNQYSLYTYVYHHKNFVRDIVALNQHRKPLECIRDGCTNDETSQGCSFPNNPAHGNYSEVSSPVGVYKPGDIVPLYSAIVMPLNCNRGYAANPPSEEENLYFCLGSATWTPTPKTCTRTCPSLITTTGTKVECSLSGVPLKTCMNPLENTIAVISCMPFYEDQGLLIFPSRVCKDGSWNFPLPNCTPVCGRKQAVEVPNITNNNNVTHSNYPWQVAVYDAEKRFICGGALVSTNIALSAAHCFTDFEGEVLPKENYYIAGGKYYNNYDDERDYNAQYSQIYYIHVPIGYRGNTNNYKSDIAVIILSTSFLISSSIQPVCLDLDRDYETVGIGIVTGWGGVNDSSTEGLADLFVTHIPYDKCFEEAPKTFRKYITQDKICAAGFFNTTTTICKIGSGGPLIFPKIVQGDDKFFIRGIASVFAASPEGTCDPDVYGTFTSIAKNINFLEHILMVET